MSAVDPSQGLAPEQALNPEWAMLLELANKQQVNLDDDDYQEDGADGQAGGSKAQKSNILQLWGNVKTMNLNNVILQNILASPYFKNYLINMKTYHEIVDEIYSQVSHLEPWEKGSRKTTGQVGMCGGVRGVGAGGIVSSAFCLLFKLFTLHLTRKQLLGLIRNRDSPYIRGIGFLYIRYCLPPEDMWDWFSPYIDDDEEVDVKAGGGHALTIGELLRHFLTKLDWYSTLFPRIPIPVQKKIMENLEAHDKGMGYEGMEYEVEYVEEPIEPAVAQQVKQAKTKEPEVKKDDKSTFKDMLSKELERHNRLEPEKQPEKDPKSTRRRSRSRSPARRRDDRRDTRDNRARRRSRSRSRHRSRSDSRSRRRHRRSRSHSRDRRDRSRDRGYYDSTRRARAEEDKKPSAKDSKAELMKDYLDNGLVDPNAPNPFQDDEDDDYGHVERLFRRADARKAAMAKSDNIDEELGLAGGSFVFSTGGARKVSGGRPNVFI